MSISVSSWRKLFIAVSLIALDLTYFFRFIVFSEIPRFTIHGRWSDIWLGIMEDEMTMCLSWGVLQNIWSMRLQECLANLVWNVILGKKLFVHIKSKNSPNFSRSEICNKFTLFALKYLRVRFEVFTCSLWSIYVFALKYLHYRREPWHKLLYIYIIIVIMRRPINVTNCKYTTEVASVDINEHTFLDIWTGT